jgi:hypothetical protein
MMLANGKPYYIAPVWPAVIGIGLGRIDAILRARRTSGPARGWERIAIISALWLAVAGYGAITLPLGLPVLPPEPLSRYAVRMGMAEATTTNTGDVISLPQDYADMLGWESLSDAVVRVWNGLSDDDRSRAVIIATNYGRAGAIDWFAPDHMPAVLAPVGRYWFWGPGERPGEVARVVGGDAEELQAFYGSVVEAARVARPWGVPEERDVAIFVARDPVRPLQEVWPEFKGQN